MIACVCVSVSDCTLNTLNQHTTNQQKIQIIQKNIKNVDINHKKISHLLERIFGGVFKAFALASFDFHVSKFGKLLSQPAQHTHTHTDTLSHIQST